MDFHCLQKCLVLSVASWGSVNLAVSSSSWEWRFLYSHERYSIASRNAAEIQDTECCYNCLPEILGRLTYPYLHLHLRTYEGNGESWLLVAAIHDDALLVWATLIMLWLHFFLSHYSCFCWNWYNCYLQSYQWNLQSHRHASELIRCGGDTMDESLTPFFHLIWNTEWYHPVSGRVSQSVCSRKEVKKSGELLGTTY
jgi:hypothetical protein